MNEIKLTYCIAGKTTQLPPVALPAGFVFAGICQWGDGFVVAVQPELTERERAMFEQEALSRVAARGEPA